MNKHTPGPWFVEREFYPPNGCENMGLKSITYRLKENTFEAIANNVDPHNANLIAAAPELLEVLKQLVRKTSGNFKLADYEGPAYITREDIVVKMAVEAIAKAGGKRAG